MRLKGSRAVVLLAAAVGVAVTARLGVWQLDRAAQKTGLQATLDQRRALPPLPAGELAATAAAAAGQHHRAVVLQGRWSAAHSVYLDNRQMNGRPGFYVVTPLLLADGSAVAVQRGWLPRDQAERTRIAPPATPDGVVQVAGRIAPPPGRLYEFDGAASGPIRQNLDLAAFGQESGLALRPLSVVQEDGPLAPADGLLRQWPRPAADVHKHHGYAFQWFALATLILGLYVWFQLLRPRLRR
ncbi:SURF1 family protein [Rubrivivax sp. RP6-9]|uniref:SURF1 family protein n=1 Tax=Rubrivivax sp. RP6-9 TaxID=3415750 RepID=UPI003CC555F4